MRNGPFAKRNTTKFGAAISWRGAPPVARLLCIVTGAARPTAFISQGVTHGAFFVVVLSIAAAFNVVVTFAQAAVSAHRWNGGSYYAEKHLPARSSNGVVLRWAFSQFNANTENASKLSKWWPGRERTRRAAYNDKVTSARWLENRRYARRRRRGRRLRKSIWNAVIESARCEHVELIDCEEYETDEMRCMVTATGMPCCVCSGQLKTLSARIRRRHRLPASLKAPTV